MSRRAVAAACLVAMGALLVVGIVIFGLGSDGASRRDYLQYWSAEQLYVHGGNPYDSDAILRLERSAGFDKPSPMISLSPPVAWFFALPLGWVSARTGLVLWVLLLMACLLVSIGVLWLVMGRPESRYHLIGIFFPPVLWCLSAGQLGIFFLLEIVLFFYWHEKMPWLAGASLALVATKPHLFLPFLLALALWSMYKREFRVVAGLAVAVAAGCLLTLSLDTKVWAEYSAMMRASHIMNEFLPTVGVALRFLINHNAKWIEFVGEVAGCLWVVWYFFARRERWDWNREGLTVLLVSLACTPYSWYTDQAIVFPTVAMVLASSRRPARALISFAALAGAGLISVMAEIPLTSGFYTWTAAAWLLWYLYAKRDCALGRKELAPEN